MDWNIDESSLSSFLNDPSQPVSTVSIPNSEIEIARINADLRDFSGMRSDSSSLFNSNNDVNGDISDAILKLFVAGYQQSQTVNPVYTSDESRVLNEEQVKHQQIIQFDGSQSEKIQIKCNPRSKFRPRTEKESQDSTHYIRCEDHIQPQYPTIYIPKNWAKQKNIIQVTLFGIDDQPHPYTIENKERKTSSLIFKREEPNSLYFYLTKQDYQAGEKTFFIEYIKSKQDNIITKTLIQRRQLNQSKLRFTRYYQIADGSYEKDEASIADSSVMSEDYGDFSIEDVFPLYGPMCGNQKVCVEVKGPLPKDFKTDLIINITENGINWPYQVKDIKKNGNNLTFHMPAFPDAQIDRAKVNIVFEYKQEIIRHTSYIYTRELDKELGRSNSDESTIYFDAGLSSSNSYTPLPICSSTGIGCEDRRAKRARMFLRKKN